MSSSSRPASMGILHTHTHTYIHIHTGEDHDTSSSRPASMGILHTATLHIAAQANDPANFSQLPPVIPPKPQLTELLRSSVRLDNVTLGGVPAVVYAHDDDDENDGQMLSSDATSERQPLEDGHVDATSESQVPAQSQTQTQTQAGSSSRESGLDEGAKSKDAESEQSSSGNVAGEVQGTPKNTESIDTAEAATATKAAGQNSENVAAEEDPSESAGEGKGKKGKGKKKK
jgi:hypothetical protein